RVAALDRRGRRRGSRRAQIRKGHGDDSRGGDAVVVLVLLLDDVDVIGARQHVIDADRGGRWNRHRRAAGRVIAGLFPRGQGGDGPAPAEEDVSGPLHGVEGEIVPGGRRRDG